MSHKALSLALTCNVLSVFLLLLLQQQLHMQRQPELPSSINSNKFSVDRLHVLFCTGHHSAYQALTCSKGGWYWIMQHRQPQQLCCGHGQKTQTAQSVWQCRSFSILGTYLFQKMLLLGCAALSTATLLWTEDTNCTMCLAMQIIQHTEHLPVSRGCWY